MIDAGTYLPAEVIQFSANALSWDEADIVDRWLKWDPRVIAERVDGPGVGFPYRLTFPARIPAITTVPPARRPQWRMPEEPPRQHANCYSTITPIYAETVARPPDPGRILDVTL